MATGQTLLDTMEVLFPEMQLQSGEGNVTHGLIALNRAQDIFETHAAQYGDVFGGAVGTLATTSSQEYTTYPSGLLRIDGIDMLDQTSLRPTYPLAPIKRRGGHAQNDRWPYYLYTTSTSGKPTAYWTNGTRVYWNVLPNDAYTLRYYGFSAASDITAVGTFAYPDAAILPFASVAAKILKIGLDDAHSELNAFAVETFNALLDQLTGYRRDGPAEYEYTRHHDV